MATTYLEAINRVLEKVGEETISNAATSLTETYEILIGSFINDIKEQIEDAHNWRALRQTVNVSVAAEAQSAVITEANERSRLIRIYQSDNYQVVPLCFDVTDASEPTPLKELDFAELIYRDTMDPNNPEDPVYFALDNSSGDVLELYVYPRPRDIRDIQITLVIPQARFGKTDVATNFQIPIRPLIVGATWYALEERGEELGTSGTFNEQRFEDALNAAIARDDAESGNPTELVAI